MLCSFVMLLCRLKSIYIYYFFLLLLKLYCLLIKHLLICIYLKKKVAKEKIWKSKIYLKIMLNNLQKYLLMFKENVSNFFFQGGEV